MQALYRRIADDLRRQIADGDLTVGACLPSESQLAEHWAASRGTVRQALGALRSEGLVGGGRGRQPIVLSTRIPQPFETLLSFSSWARGTGREPGQRVLELARRPADPEVAGALAIDEGQPVVQLLRLRLLDGAPTMLERTTFGEHVGRLLFAADLDAGSVYAHLLGAGVHITTARHRFDAVPADPTDAGVLDVALGAPLLRERRTAHGHDGEPCEYSDDRYRPDLVTFTIENTRDAVPSLARDVDDRPGGLRA